MVLLTNALGMTQHKGCKNGLLVFCRLVVLIFWYIRLALPESVSQDLPRRKCNIMPSLFKKIKQRASERSSHNGRKVLDNDQRQSASHDMGNGNRRANLTPDNLVSDTKTQNPPGQARLQSEIQAPGKGKGKCRAEDQNSSGGPIYGAEETPSARFPSQYRQHGFNGYNETRAVSIKQPPLPDKCSIPVPVLANRRRAPAET